MSWRTAKSILTLVSELDKAYPKRTKPDWIIGDAAHRSRASDHNPNAANVVCAIDVREGNIDLGRVAEAIRKRNPKAVKYVIFNRRIWSKARNTEGWRPYTGKNPHTTHMHVSVGEGPDGKSTGPYDDTGAWGVASGGSGGGSGGSGQYEDYAKGAKPASRTIGAFETRPRSAGDDVKDLQRVLNTWYPKLTKLSVDGYFGPKTAERVKYFQLRAKIAVDGIVGPQTWKALGYR
jgi:hypothetical protein